VGVAIWVIKLALRLYVLSLYAESQSPEIRRSRRSYGRRTDGHDYINSAIKLIKNIYTSYSRKRFLLPVAYFSTNLVYPFTQRVTGIKSTDKSIKEIGNGNARISERSTRR